MPTPAVSFVWTPQVAGSPDIPANSPAAYYPGDRYVDWVGTDFYSRFPNFTGLETFYNEFSSNIQGNTNSFGVRGALEFPAFGLPWMVEGDYRSYQYENNGCPTAPPGPPRRTATAARQ